jgi:hypothetical protein
VILCDEGDLYGQQQALHIFKCKYYLRVLDMSIRHSLLQTAVIGLSDDLIQMEVLKFTGFIAGRRIRRKQTRPEF